MSQSRVPVLPQVGPSSHERPRRARAPLVERVAGWSARHRKTAVFGWLALVAIVIVAGQALGGKAMTAYDAGQAGQAEQALHRLGVVSPAVEDVLIQARAPGRTFAADPAMRQAARQVTAALAALPKAAMAIRSPLEPGNRGLVSADGRSALVTFQVPGPATGQATAVGPAQHAVAVIAARYPGLRIGEGGDASSAAAINGVLGSG